MRPKKPIPNVNDAAAETAGNEQRPERKHILIVEDDATNLRLASHVVSRAGWECTVASNGAECLERFDERRYDLVLMDCQMPILDGYEATRQIRDRERASGGHVTVIAFTANSQPGQREACLDAGMDGYLAKPYKPDELVDCIEAWIGSGVRRKMGRPRNGTPH